MNTSVVIKELLFQTSRSSGAGGQHVNKVESRVTLSFHILNSQGLTASEKAKIHHKLQSRINSEGYLLMHCSQTRSQHRNKELLIRRFLDLIKNSLRAAKKRIATKPTKSSIRKRLEVKKRNSLKKTNRKTPDY